MSRGFWQGALGATLMTVLGAVGAAAQSTDMGVGKEAGSFLIRARAALVSPDVSSTIPLIGGKVSASDSGSPEVDFSYFFTENFAAELIAASTRHVIKAKGTALGTVALGSIWVLPPTLTAQYHFNPKGRFSPYVGAGVNVTFFYNGKTPGGLIQKVNYKNTVAPALQAGMDIGLGGRWFLNADIKKIFISTDAKINGGFIVAKADLNPYVAGIGFGYRF